MSEHHRRLDPSDPANHYCRNCGHHHGSADVHFCAACGQKNTDGRSSMGEIFHEFLHNTLHLDGKFFRMLGHLFIPGKLTAEFFLGRQKRYPHPTRFFLVVAGLFLYLLNSTMHLKGKSDIPTQSKEKTLLGLELRESYEGLPPRLRTTDATAAFDTVFERMNFGSERDSFHFNSFGQKPIILATLDLHRLTPDSLIRKYKIEGFFRKAMLRQSIKVADEPTSIVHAWLGTATGTILLLLGLMSPVLLLLFRRTRPYLVEHFIFLMHHTTTLLLGLSAVMLLRKIAWLHSAATILALAWWLLWMTAGMLLAMRRFYHRRWGQTVGKWLIFSALYALIGMAAVYFSLMVAFFFLV